MLKIISQQISNNQINGTATNGFKLRIDNAVDQIFEIQQNLQQVNQEIKQKSGGSIYLNTAISASIINLQRARGHIIEALNA